MPPTSHELAFMSGTARIAVAVEDLLQDLFRWARESKFTLITVEHMLALLLDEPGIAAFLRERMPAEIPAAMRAELYALLVSQKATQAAPRWSRAYWLKKLKARRRADLPRFSEDAEHVLMRAILRVAPPAMVQDTDLLLSIIDNTSGAASAILARHDVARYALVCHMTNVAHPVPAVANAGFPMETAAVRLLLLNDDFTPMAFVVDLLQTVFSKSPQEANALMLEIHTSGRAACGIFSPAAASEKRRQVEQLAAAQQHPLRAVLAPVDQVDALMA